MDLVKELKDMTFLDWTEQKLSPGTPGCFLKAYEETEHGRVYYKLSNYDSYQGVFGHECCCKQGHGSFEDSSFTVSTDSCRNLYKK